MPDPAFGVMFASMVGALLFLLMATVAQSYRNAVRSTFTRFNPWLFAAGVLASVGQLLYFIAIDYSTISRVTLIVSLEVFVTIFLMVVVFRSREKMTPAALVAAALGVTGTVVILLGGT
jgi:drug/metabolite transporter (DMT)-like permease